MFGATFNLVTRVDLPYFIEHLKDSSLKTNSLLINKCFSYRNVFQNGEKALSKMVFKNVGFGQKAQNFLYFEPYDLVQISLARGPNRYQIIYGKTL